MVGRGKRSRAIGLLAGAATGGALAWWRPNAWHIGSPTRLIATLAVILVSSLALAIANRRGGPRA